MKKILIVLFGILIASGSILLLGTAGSSDIGAIDAGTSFVRCAIGLGLLSVGYIGLRKVGVTYCG